MGRHIGKIVLDDEILLAFLDFRFGKIILSNKETYNTTSLTIEHEDMPEVKEGDAVPIVTPTYTTYQDAMGNKIAIRDRE